QLISTVERVDEERVLQQEKRVVVSSAVGIGVGRAECRLLSGWNVFEIGIAILGRSELLVQECLGPHLHDVCDERIVCSDGGLMEQAYRIDVGGRIRSLRARHWR